MNSYLVYRASFYLMLFVATMALSGETPEGQFAKLLGLVVAVAGAVAFYAVDRKQMLVLPRQLANILAVGTLGVLYFEYRLDDTQRIPALAHWLVYLQLIKYFLPKTAEDDWFLFLLGLMQVLIGSVVNQSDQVGTLALRVGHARRLGARPVLSAAGSPPILAALRRSGGMPWQSARQEFHAPSVDPYRGLFDFPYVAATVRVMVTTLALGGLIFLVLPRQAGATRSQSGAPLARHLTGFDEEVQLGQLGEILENDSVVMTVQLSDENGDAIRPDEEPLWRGVTMLHYEGGRWVRQTKGTQAIVSFKDDARLKNGRLIRQKIKLEPIDSPTLFGIRPILNAVVRLSASSALFQQQRRHALSLRSSERRIRLRGRSPIATPRATSHTKSPPHATRGQCFPVDASGLERKAQGDRRAHRCRHRPRSARRHQARACALEAYLRESGKFTYTLQMEIFDPKLDPVEDFLVNRKSGHCEYFASALALLLRSVGIRSRVVNGFKGGDWNELTEALERAAEARP